MGLGLRLTVGRWVLVWWVCMIAVSQACTGLKHLSGPKTADDRFRCIRNNLGPDIRHLSPPNPNPKTLTDILNLKP